VQTVARHPLDQAGDELCVELKISSVCERLILLSQLSQMPGALTLMFGPWNPGVVPIDQPSGPRHLHGD
jgi:hypothetical protein